jgi:hypothetical protein
VIVRNDVMSRYCLRLHFSMGCAAGVFGTPVHVLYRSDNVVQPTVYKYRYDVTGELALTLWC